MIAEITKKRNSLPKTERFLPGLRKEMVANRQRVSIGLLGRNEMFGQEEILKKSKRKTKAVCVSSKTTIFYIHKEVLKKKFFDKYFYLNNLHYFLYY